MPVVDEIRDLRGVVEDAVAYPLLTREVSGDGTLETDATAPTSRTGTPSLTSTAQNAIRDLLGWRFRRNDPKGFLAALSKTVDLKDVEGHTEWTWKTRPFMVQADLGEVTGAQASIYARAKVALDQILPLLETLKPARPDFDQEQVESIRSLVRTAWTEMVSELTLVSGPRVERIDRYFEQLLGDDDPANIQPVFAQPALAGGRLGELRDRFGLIEANVNTVAGEQNRTNFLIIVDQTTSFLQTWNAQKSFLGRNGAGNPFLGTQLVRLSQDLAVVVESVRELYAIMDSLFFGAEERQVTVVNFNIPGVQPMTMAEMLSWIEQFASVEARQLIEDCGRDGVNTVRDTLGLFQNMLNNIA